MNVNLNIKHSDMLSDNYLDISYITQLLDLYEKGVIPERDFDTLCFIAVEFFSLEKAGRLPNNLNTLSLRQQLAPIALLAEADMALSENVKENDVPENLLDTLKNNISILSRSEQSGLGIEDSGSRHRIRVNPFKRIIGAAASVCGAAIIGGIIYFSLSSPSIPTVDFQESYSKSENSCQQRNSSVNESGHYLRISEESNSIASASGHRNCNGIIVSRKENESSGPVKIKVTKSNDKEAGVSKAIAEEEEVVNTDSVINLLRKVGLRVEDVKNNSYNPIAENLTASASEASEMIEEMVGTLDHILLNVNRTMRQAGNISDENSITLSESSFSNILNLQNTIF